MPQKSLCYFLQKDGDNVLVFNEHFERITPDSLNGLFSFIYYPTAIVLGPIAGFSSRHKGLGSLVMVIRQQEAKHRHPLFSASIRKLLPQGAPIAGGGVWFDKGYIILWHLKSGSISLDNPECHDTHPNINQVIDNIGFPKERRMTLAQTEWFEERHMRKLFMENGDYIDPSSAQFASHNILKELALLKRQQRRKKITSRRMQRRLLTI